MATRLTGEAARKWLAENPNATYVNNKTGQRVERQKSGVEKLLLGVSKPFRQGLGIAGEFGGTIEDLLNIAKGRDSEQGKGISRQLGNFFLTPEEEAELVNDPLKVGLKAGAGVASYGIPVGAAKGVTGLKAIGQAAGKGALAGGVGGFGYSEEGKELEGILKGGALGGVIGGGLQAVGEGVRKISSLKNGTGKISGELSTAEIDALPKGVKAGLKKQAQSAGYWDGSASDMDNYIFFAKNRQYAGNTPKETLQNITKAIEKGKDLKIVGLDKVGNVGDDVLQTARQNFKNSVAKGGFSKTAEFKGAYNDVDEILSGRAGVYSARDLDLRIMDWEEAGRKASGQGKAGAASAYTEGATALRSTMRSLPSGSSYDEGLKLLDSLYEIEKPGTIEKAAVSMQKTGVHPPFTANANVSLSPIAEKGSKIRAGIGRLQEGIVPEVGAAAEQIPGAFRLGQRAIPGIVGMGTQPKEEQVALGTQGIAEQGVQQQYTFPDAIAEAYSYFPNASEAQIITVAKYLMDQKGGGDVDMGTIANVQQAIDMIDQYGTGAAGKISTLTGKVGEFFGSASQGTTYRSLISDIRTKLIKQIAGTAQTPAEMKNLMDRLPQPTDEPAVAKAKLQVLLNSLQGGGAGNPSEESAVSDYESW